ncbi:hypothetical protein OAG29_01910 [Planctomycetaceae bacterium]|nr:hypothetical protein [Planctomycetaceae bacterium]
MMNSDIDCYRNVAGEFGNKRLKEVSLLVMRDISLKMLICIQKHANKTVF